MSNDILMESKNVQSKFTDSAGEAFDEFCKKYFNVSNGKFMMSLRKSTRNFANPTKPPHVQDIFNPSSSLSNTTKQITHNQNENAVLEPNRTANSINGYYFDTKNSFANGTTTQTKNSDYYYDNNYSEDSHSVKNESIETKPTDYYSQTGHNKNHGYSNHNRHDHHNNHERHHNQHQHQNYNHSNSNHHAKNNAEIQRTHGKLNHHDYRNKTDQNHFHDNKHNRNSNLINYTNASNKNHSNVNQNLNGYHSFGYQPPINQTSNQAKLYPHSNGSTVFNKEVKADDKKIIKQNSSNKISDHNHNHQSGTIRNTSLKPKFMPTTTFLKEFRRNGNEYDKQHLMLDMSTTYDDALIEKTSEKKIGKIGLKVVACGMAKGARLPVPRSNYFIDRGDFGDDAGFWSEIEGFAAIGLADGATGNIMLGYDPGDFPRHLMKLCSNLFVEQNDLRDPKDLLMKAFDILQDKSCYGSSTACVLTIDYETCQLKIANIGDSGYRLFRNGRIIRKSEPQRISSDCPRQLDSYPWKAETRALGVSYTEILGNDAVCDSVQVLKDDVIILSSDGLYDNIEDNQIEEIFNKSKSVVDAAEKLVQQATKFYKKPDDILIIIGKLIENKPIGRHAVYSKSVGAKNE